MGVLVLVLLTSAYGSPGKEIEKPNQRLHTSTYQQSTGIILSWAIQLSYYTNH